MGTVLSFRFIGTGSIKTIPILMGSNRDEGAEFLKLPRNATQAQFEKFVVDWADQETLDAIERLCEC